MGDHARGQGEEGAHIAVFEGVSVFFEASSDAGRFRWGVGGDPAARGGRGCHSCPESAHLCYSGLYSESH